MIQLKRLIISFLTTALALTTASGTRAQQPLDRKQIPPPGKTPPLRVPAWTKTTLSNGATLLISEQHNLPLVSFSITFLGGANQFETASKRGLASMTATMLNEGTATKSGDQISDALQLLGTSINANIGGEQGAMGFVSTTARFDATLAVLSDLLLHPSFPADALERLRGRTLIDLVQAKDQPEQIGTAVFAKTLYGTTHPYGQRPTESSIKAITRDDIVAFHKAYFKPGNALLTVVGDVKPAAVKAAVEQALKAWPKAGRVPSFDYPKAPAPGPTTIYLVDKPGAAQSIFALGLPGPARKTTDYYALQVLNHILGGQFQSRLNANIREEHGYSYGVSSSFAFGKGPGAFRAGGAIVSGKTDAALIEFMKELRGIEGARPVTDEELKTSKDALIQGLPRTFGSVAATGASITSLSVQGLPDDYYQSFAKNIAAITREDLLRVAKQYIDLDQLAIIIVGDRALIEAPLKATGIAPITILDIEGNPVTSGGNASGAPKN